MRTFVSITSRDHSRATTTVISARSLDQAGLRAVQDTPDRERVTGLKVIDLTGLSEHIVSSGIRLYEERGVTVFARGANGSGAAYVRGSQGEQYVTAVTPDNRSACQCMAGRFDNDCKHVVALRIELLASEMR